MPKVIFDSSFASNLPPLPGMSSVPPRVARAIKYGRSGMCYWNCDDYVAEFGGKVIYGWQPSGWPPVIIELLHHAIVETQDGELVDPTPMDGLELVTTLLYPDPSIVPARDYPSFIPNRFYAWDGGYEARETIQRAHENQMTIKRRQIAILKSHGIPWPVTSPINANELGPEFVDVCIRFEQSKDDIDQALSLCEAAQQTAIDALEAGSAA